jgi:hypothetical protein
LTENGHQPPARTAADKIIDTLREMSQPDESASEMELTLATMALGMLSTMGEQIQQAQDAGELDAFVLTLSRWIAAHRSDGEKLLLVLEVPRRPLPAGTRLHLMDEAMLAAEDAGSPF